MIAMFTLEVFNLHYGTKYKCLKKMLLSLLRERKVRQILTWISGPSLKLEARNRRAETSVHNTYAYLFLLHPSIAKAETAIPHAGERPQSNKDEGRPS